MTTENESLGKQAVQLLVESGLGPQSEFEGCTEADIRELETEFDVELPETYKSCLRHIGRDSNTLFRGTEFTIDSIPTQREYAERELDEENADFEFGDSDFVFKGHQGHTFLFFDTEAGDDPPVYEIMPPEEPRKKAESFSEWLLDEIHRHIKVQNEYSRRFGD